MHTQTGQVLYISHGGGPLPLLHDPGHRKMVTFMQELPTRIRRPEMILVISAHWEEKVPTLLSGENPPMFYDYYGFPDEAYTFSYPAKGNPELAAKVGSLLEKAGLTTELDERRGFDHGVFIPLMLMYPEADIPVLQLSLVRGLDAALHLKLGLALQSLLNENILVIGSGFSFHNMRAFSFGSENTVDPENDAFQNWLIDVCTGKRSKEESLALLRAWDKAPAARYCHPREEHLLPLHVCSGLGKGDASLIFDDYILGKRSVAFLWE